MDPDIAAVTKRDEAFRRYVVPELEVLLRVARRLTGEEHTAQDVVQDALLRAWRAVDRFDGRYPRAWLLTILRNAFKNHLRKHKAHLSDFSQEVAEAALARGADGRRGPEEYVVDDVLDAALAEALMSLSAKFRTVVLLVDVEALTYQEAADALGIPIGTVMSRLHRARSQLRDQLRDAGHLPGGRS